MKRGRNGYTMRQGAYANNLLGAKGRTKKDIALSVGYSPTVASKTLEKIESTEGFSNAMAKLASENGNLALQIYHTLKHKDLGKESVPVLLDAITTLANAWQVYAPRMKDDESKKGNSLRTIVLQNFGNAPIPAPVHDVAPVSDEDDF